MKKKAQEKLAAKANPAPVIEDVVETPAEVVAEMSEPTATDVVAEVPVEPVTTDVAVEPSEAAAE
ncbi:unannotated protein [freshwater metagenome]|uniref:Unannotated protein n=1 Tax=freshwater metagenome TaxID=449393 RepID=A0A6J6BBZ8_9ZZZZ